MHTPQTLAKELTMSDMREDMLNRLAKQRASKLERSKALWKMTADERVSAMRRDELTWGQLCEWASRARHEVPLLNGEFEFIAVLTPEVADTPERK
jgi:hypothetical protein